MIRIIPNDALSQSDLVVDAVYEGGHSGHTGDDPISKTLKGAGNQGGFRTAGIGQDKKFVVLYTSGEDGDWPDTLDLNTGQFIYYGDNKTPGHELHETGPGGNRILRHVFELLHSSPSSRALIPPFFVFKKYPTPTSARSVQFKGLAVPGFSGLPFTSDLVAVWKTSKGQRFQNYRAVFTVLDIPVVPRLWLDELSKGENAVASAPDAWSEWVRGGHYRALTSASTTIIRSVEAQTPGSRLKAAVSLDCVRTFQRCARGVRSFCGANLPNARFARHHRRDHAGQRGRRARCDRPIPSRIERRPRVCRIFARSEMLSPGHKRRERQHGRREGGIEANFTD
jgi:hypothetical protein